MVSPKARSTLAQPSLRGSSWTSVSAAHDAPPASVDIDRRAASIRSNDLNTIDPFVAEAEEVDGDDVTRIPRFDNAQDVAERKDFAMFIELARVIVIPVAIRAGGQGHRQRKGGNPANCQFSQPSAHERGMLHLEAVNLLAAVPRAAGGEAVRTTSSNFA